MTADDLLERALLTLGPDSYSPKARGAVINAETCVFTATGLLERANCSLSSGASGYLRRGNPALLVEAKERVCRAVRAPHIDHWEAVRRPDWEDVQTAFLDALQ